MSATLKAGRPDEADVSDVSDVLPEAGEAEDNAAVFFVPVVTFALRPSTERCVMTGAAFVTDSELTSV